MIFVLKTVVFIIFYIFFLLNRTVNGTVVIKTGVNEENAQQKNANVFGISSKLGLSDFKEAQGYNMEGEKKFLQNENSEKFNEATGEKKIKSDAGKFADEKFFNENGGALADVGQNTSYKKGHHKAGFHKKYNKDESGSESTFFDDGSDEGGQLFQKSFNGKFADQGMNQNHGSHADDVRFENENAKQGAFSKGDMYKKDIDDRKAYDTKKYYDGHENMQKSGLEDNHALKGDKGYYEDKIIPITPMPFHPPMKSLPAQKTITIYEDPRVYSKERLRDRGGYEDRSKVKLDIRPPPPSQSRHYDDSYYDYYY